MKWNDIRNWSWTLLMFAVLSFIGCGTPKTITKQTYITDKSSEKKWDSIFNSRLSYAFEQYQQSQSRERDRDTKDSMYVRDSTATRYDANGNKIGEDRFHYESHNRTEKDYQRLLDSVSSYRAFKDSCSYYRAKCDSLDKVARQKDIYEYEGVPSSKSLSKIQEVFFRTGQMFYFCLVLLILYYIYLFRKRKDS